ncbi:MAG: DUF6263 family protein [Bacteroidota bacterium]
MRVILAGVSVMMVFLFSACKNSYDLQFKPKAGSRYEVRMTTNSVTSQELGVQKMDIKTLTELVMLYEVQNEANTNDSSKTIKVTFKSMKNTQGSNGQSFVTDTNNPDTSNPASRMMNAMMGSEFIVTISKQGDVKNITGKDALVQRIINAAGVTDSMMQEQMVTGIQNFMSDEILKNMMEQSFKIFPATKVKKGDSWKSNMVITKPLPMNIQTTFLLKDVKGKEATIDLSSIVSPGTGGMQMMGVNVETELGGTQTGSMQVDMETGMALNADISQNITGKMKAMGEEMPMTIQSVITMKSTKL